MERRVSLVAFVAGIAGEFGLSVDDVCAPVKGVSYA